jgi:chemotaxis receptor (MCP) glutamine deamidase CheD
VKVLPGEYFVFDEDILIMTTLGSCIAACLWDRETRIGGMNHFMLPEGGGSVSDGGRYGSYAMELLINELIKRGATRSTLEAKVFGGGAVISGMNSMNVGERNTKFVLDYLQTERIRWCPRTCWTSTRARCASCRPAARPWSSAWRDQHRGAGRAGARRPQRRATNDQRRRLGRPVLTPGPCNAAFNKTRLRGEPKTKWWWSTIRRWCAACWPRSSTGSRTCSASARPATRWWRAR